MQERQNRNTYQSELKREYDEVENLPEKEKSEVRVIFEEYGLNQATQNIIADELAKDKHKWVDFMMKYELGLEKPDVNRARNSAATIGISYIVGGLIPLTAYFFTSTPYKRIDDLGNSDSHMSLRIWLFQKQSNRAAPAPRGTESDYDRSYCSISSVPDCQNVQ